MMIKTGLFAVSLAALVVCQGVNAKPLPELKNQVSFPIGVAVPLDPAPNSLLHSPERQSIVNQQFDSMTAENAMKMAYLQPSQGQFDFSVADKFVAYAKAHHIAVHGHALVWHNQKAPWMDKFNGSNGQFTQIMTRHVATVVKHFAGQLLSWDVVNEAFTDDNPSVYRDSIWYKHIGPGYIERAFRTARANDANVELYYNDYNLSGNNPAKLTRVLQMADDFLARGVPIDGIGFQMHINTDSPTLAQMADAFAKVVKRGLKVRISELDIGVNQSKQNQHFTPQLAELQKKRYQQVVALYLRVVPAPLRGGITVWGLTDGDSWIPGFKKRPDWPLLFDNDFKPKPAFWGMLNGLQGKEVAQ